MAKYADNAVFLPGRGAVLIAEPLAGIPNLEAIQGWISAGATGDVQSGDKTYTPIGHTSLDELPTIDSDTEGGEVKGSWENPSLRQTSTTTTDSITVTPIQWTQEALQHRFGADGSVDGKLGTFTIPKIYKASEVSIMVVILDSQGPLVIQYNRAVSAPEGGIEPDPENFLGIPTKYTILNPTDGERGTIMHAGLKAPVEVPPQPEAEETDQPEPAPGAGAGGGQPGAGAA